MGQGNASTNLQIAGHILGQPMDALDLVLPDTAATLPSGSASASRCTYTFGNALIGAAHALRDRILQRAADLFMAAGTQDVALVPHAVRNLRNGKEFPLAVIARMLDPGERVAVHRFRAPVATDDVKASDQLRLHGMPHCLFSYGAHLAMVEVDELTGNVEVVSYLAVSDCGMVLNPCIYEQQIQGAVAQGIGYAVSEEFLVDRGRTVTKELSTYLIPTALDVPDIVSMPLQLYEQTGPFGLKGVGEVAVNGPLPAIANAVADALGRRVLRFPLTPERVLNG
jgi:CO/xanthine dehydrogenase Mo-binding subunit